MSNVAVLREVVAGVQARAPEVADQLRSAEIAVDETISNIANLTAMIIETRIEGRLAAAVGHDALSSLADAMQTIIKGRGSIVDAHSQLANAGKKLRLDPRSYGGMDYKPV